MKKYVVAFCSLFENEIKFQTVEAESEYEALKAASLANADGDSIEWEREYQESENYPKDLESLKTALFDGELIANLIEISC